MQIYLPIAEQSMNVFLIVGIGWFVGFLSGMFGVGGGFIATPLLIFSGIPPAVAVSTGANQIVASSVAGTIAQWRRGNVDVRMGLVLLAGGIVGSVFGVYLVSLLRGIGQIDLVIALCYVFFLGIVGGLMALETSMTYLRKRSGKRTTARRAGQHAWVHGLPFKMRFKRSKLYISILPPLAVGCLVGLLAAVMGVGGGFIMVPAMIYLLRMPTSVVVGTSLFQIVFVTGLVTILHSTYNQTVDVVLALLLMLGGVLGAQSGTIAGARLNGEQMRGLLALLVLAMCARIAFDLVVSPDEMYSITSVARGIKP